MSQTPSIEMTSKKGKRKTENNENGVQEERLSKPSSKERREIKSNVNTEPGGKAESSTPSVGDITQTSIPATIGDSQK
ncbi:hypothetical protein HU200_005545 [Digitaria exilis]|uniref:Uncharacterized protein n=1 Tax=Digitaria exilis TaxID=1010633 RepID=A0A835FQR6_9POAL|nr:hypothetical protein HU200_005545 [Digitaria exilis]